MLSTGNPLAMLVDWDPIMIQIGPLAIRWYGFFMAVSIGLGIYYLVRYGVTRGLPEEKLYNTALVAVVGGVIGARLIYVATNWSDYADNLIEIIRVDHGGLSFHGAVGGGMLFAWLYARRIGLPVARVFDLAVPGICIGIMLVRIGNIFNQEAVGRPAAALPFELHPAQIYGSLIGVILLISHNVLARKYPNAPDGYLFWTFVFWYQLLRGAWEETFRANPLYVWGYINETWGIGLFTMTQLVTPPILLLAWWMRRRALEAGSYGSPHLSRAARRRQKRQST